MRLIATTLLLALLPLGSCGRTSSPGSAQSVVLERADALLAEGEYARAVELLDSASGDGLPPASFAERLAVALVGAGEIPRAVRVCRAALDAEPGATAVSTILADVYFSIGKYQLAADTLLEAREHGGSDAEVALPLGVSFGRLRDLSAARAEFERAAAAGAPRPDVDYNMAILLIEDGAHAEAEALLRGVLEVAPARQDARRELARLCLCPIHGDGDRLEEAVRLLNVVLDERPEDWRAYELMGDAYMVYEDPEAAVAFYTEALRHGRNPLHVEDKYRTAVHAQNEFLRDQGLHVQEPSARGTPPPLVDSMREMLDRARRERASSSESEEPPAGPGGGRKDD